MTIDRRQLLGAAALAAGAAALVSCTGKDDDAGLKRLMAGDGDWADFRALFAIDPEWIDMSAMLLTSHPQPVANAIAKYREALDNNPAIYLRDNNDRLQEGARSAAGAYLGIAGENIALTDSTTQSVALVYRGLKLKAGQDVLTTTRDYYVSHEALRVAADRSGATVRKIPLYETLDGITAEALADSVIRELKPNTRVVAMTWVHSSTGLKMPIGLIGERLARHNAGRGPDDRVLLCVDGVHGFGNQDATLDSLGADFLMAGCHKWLFGPRGTGIIAGRADAWPALDPTIPSFLDSDGYGRWKRDDPPVPTTAAMVTPGGFKPFEHLWSSTEAFKLHQAIGKAKIAARTAELATQLKEGLTGLANVKLRTPMSAELSAGIVSFDIEGGNPWDVVEHLQANKIIASVAPYRTPHVRLTPSIRNTPDEIDKALEIIRGFRAAA
ncbi:aminotransferase class V-fold PLP-dependent enzyme [Sphingoaurantiacus capsulatus]|uniref:Aminotransferase class V-fold PLP-dependent enzyme n=1 Tax=Sphingoaurantiacus capsulatus TaxID=1771310 RepID=A0ABV7XCC6_9SPHN